MCSLKPIDGAIEKVKSWTDAGHKVVVITSRAITLANATEKMLRESFPTVGNFYVSDWKGSGKKGFMETEKLDVWVDDSPFDVEPALELGIKTYLISNDETKYNWEVRKLDGIIVVPSVSAINL